MLGGDDFQGILDLPGEFTELASDLRDPRSGYAGGIDGRIIRLAGKKVSKKTHDFLLSLNRLLTGLVAIYPSSIPRAVPNERRSSCFTTNQYYLVDVIFAGLDKLGFCPVSCPTSSTNRSEISYIQALQSRIIWYGFEP